MKLQFDDLIQRAYSNTHDWCVKTLKRTPIPTAQEAKDGMYKEPTISNAVGQFYWYFPAHFFKVAHVLEHKLSLKNIAARFKANPRLVVLDIGCGAGTASFALIQALIKIYKNDPSSLPAKCEIVTFGVDPNPYVLQIFDEMAKHVNKALIDNGLPITFEYEFFLAGMPAATIEIVERIRAFQTEKWNQPGLPRVLITQINVASPFLSDHKIRLQAKNNFHLPVGGVNAIGEVQAKAYMWLARELQIDVLNVLTIATDQTAIYRAAQQMTEHLSTELQVKEAPELTKHTIHYINPKSSGWKDVKTIDDKQVTFYCSYFSEPLSFNRDKQWEKIVSRDNLRLAWVRARRHVLNEPIFDDTEIRLFETKLDDNLTWLCNRLQQYANDIIKPHGKLGYSAPKNLVESRPRGLTRFEEEILTTAIIQVVGDRFRYDNSYAYVVDRFETRDKSEFLYAPWFSLHKDYIADARFASTRHRNAVVLKVDISRYYENIEQDALLELLPSTHEERSVRILWLVSQVVKRPMDALNSNMGINQGSIGSGFFGNIYLEPVDRLFARPNPWNVKYFRYVDDMILVVPDQRHLATVKDRLQNELSQLGLTLNPSKMRELTVEKFRKETERDSELDKLQKRRYAIINKLLWEIGKQLKQSGKLSSSTVEWPTLRIITSCLAQLGVNFTASQLSRRIQRKSEPRYKWTPPQPTIPSLPIDNSPVGISKWDKEFTKQNKPWFAALSTFRSDLKQLLRKSKPSIEKSDQSKRRFKYAANALMQVDFQASSELLTKLLLAYIWLFRTPMRWIDLLGQWQIEKALNQITKVGYLDQKSNSNPEHASFLHAMALRAMKYAPKNEARAYIAHLREILTTTLANGDWCYTELERLQASDSLVHISATYSDLTQLCLVNPKAVSGKPNMHIDKNIALLSRSLHVDIITADGGIEDWIWPSIQHVIDNLSMVDWLEAEEPEDLADYYQHIDNDIVDLYDDFNDEYQI